AVPIKIMPLGDSITEGVAQIPDNPDQNSSNYNGTVTATADRIGYKGKLWDLLKTGGYDIDFVGSKTSGQNYPTADFDQNHEGHGGTTSAYIKQNITSFISVNPDIVLLQIGTNDPGQSIPIGSYNDVDQNRNTSVNNVKSILNTIFLKNPQAKVFVSRITRVKAAEAWMHPLGENGAVWTTTELNNKIAEMVSNHSQSQNIQMVDMFNTLSYEPQAGLPYDMQPYHSEALDKYPDFHPNQNGYVKMAQKWFDEMVASSWLGKLYLHEATPVDKFTNKNKPTYVFFSNMSGTIEYGGKCTSDKTEAKKGNNFLTFNELNDGLYNNCSIRITTYDGQTTALGITAFTVDTQKPVLHLKGANPQQIIKGSIYKELGAKATDNIDTNITNKIEVLKHNLDITKDGNYTVSYHVVDAAGNTAKDVTRKVEVLTPLAGMIDTDKDGIPDIQDNDDDNDGTLDSNDAFPLDKTEQTDTDNDGIGNNADKDDDNNGIPDTKEEDWFTYDAHRKEAHVGQSKIRGEDLRMDVSIEGDILTLKHSYKLDAYAYISVTKKGEIFSGFKTSKYNDTTLKTSTTFKNATVSSIKKGTKGIVIETITTLNKNDKIKIGAY
ncbi:MAG: DUF5011 domain-containing protein, partial [Sulfurovum sp.]|nr:DUF5011 domain-containing protein [Sulfurovum sp.]